MKNNSSMVANAPNISKKLHIKDIAKYKMLYVMLIPGVLCLILFQYLPMAGIMIAFKDYNLSEGILKSPWAGMKHFYQLFSNPTSIQIISNTIIISLYKLIFGLPAPIILALALNEVGNHYFKKLVQTISYLPYFISWVIVAGMINNILSPNGGIIPLIISSVTGEKNISLMTEPKVFRSILVISHLWKETGWSSVLYLAALSSIDVTQYEAAIIDGANRMQRIIHITLPSLYSLIITVTILACGNILNAGFDQVFNMQNSMVMEVSDIIDTYVYRIGIVQMSYSFSSAVGLFKSLTGLIMLLLVNFVSKKLTNEESGIW